MSTWLGSSIGCVYFKTQLLRSWLSTRCYHFLLGTLGKLSNLETISQCLILTPLVRLALKSVDQREECGKVTNQNYLLQQGQTSRQFDIEVGSMATVVKSNC